MKKHLDEFIRGWLVGDFEPSLYKTSDFEVAIQKYSIGDYEKRHVHKIATEWTIIVKGKAMMNSIEYNEGDIIIIKPNHSTDFLAMKDTIALVIKIPSIKDDKYLL